MTACQERWSLKYLYLYSQFKKKKKKTPSEKGDHSENIQRGKSRYIQNNETQDYIWLISKTDGR